MLTFAYLPDPYGSILELAASNPQAALRKAEALPTLARPADDQALTYYTQACCFLANEQFETAQALLERAVALLAAQPDSDLAAYCRHARQLCALSTSEPTVTAPWEALIIDYQRRRLPRAAVFAAVALGRALYHLRDISRVQGLIDDWLPAAQAHNIPFAIGSFLRLRGVTEQIAGTFSDAETHFQQAIAAFERGQQLIEAAHCLIDLAWNRVLQGDPGQASIWLEDAEATFNLHQLPLRRAICALNASIAHLHQGLFAAALYDSQVARELFRQLKRPLDSGSCDMQLGRIYSYIGHWTAAAAQIQRAITNFEQFGAVGRLASCYYNLAFILLGDNEAESALAALASAEVYARQDRNQEILRETAFLRARILMHEGLPEDAAELMSGVEEAFATAGNELGRARCWLEQGWIALDRQQPELAAAWFDRAEASIALHPLYYWRLLHGRGACRQAAGRPLEALDDYELAIQLVARFRRQLTNEHLSSFLFVQVAALFSQALACATAQGQGATALRLSEYNRTLTLQRLLERPLEGNPATDLKDLQERLLRLLDSTQGPGHAPMSQLNACLDEYAEQLWLNRHTTRPAMDEETVVDLEAIRRILTDLHGDEWTVISYTLHERALHILTQTPFAITSHQADWSAATEQLIRSLGAPYTQRMIYNDVPYLQGITPRQWGELADLAEALLPETVRGRLHPGHRLYIIPSGILHMLAWTALRVGDSWLCEQAIVQVLPYLMFAARRLNNPPATMVQLGCSDFGARANPLPMTASELSIVSAQWRGTVVALRDQDCRIEALLDPASPHSLERHGIIHLATHAYMHPAHGIMGHILLHDGELWLDQIIRLRLNNALVVMSTCNGAVVDHLPGEENLSLTWGWLMAGAKAVVSTLWPLADGSTIPLIERFYTHAAAGDDIALALARAQRECIAELGQSAVDWGNAIVIGMPMTVVEHGAGGA
ncbi:MAG TPA: CHAT domain-containing protein [Herpetosiphonaceae bacterium]